MKHIEVEKIQVRPYSPVDSIASEFPGRDLFHDRHDFILFKNQTALAVLIKMTCRDDEETSGKAQTRSFDVNLHDCSNNTLVASSRLKVVFNQWDTEVYPRIDLPFSYDEAVIGHTYLVSVMSCEKYPDCLCTHEMCFYKMDHLPTCEYKMLGSWLEECDTRFTNASNEGHYKVFPTFEVAKQHPWPGERPEFFMRVVNRMGIERFLQCAVTYTADDDEAEYPFTVSAPLKLGPDTLGELYIELQVFGIGIGSIRFNTMEPDAYGEFSSKDTSYVHRGVLMDDCIDDFFRTLNEIRMADSAGQEPQDEQEEEAEEQEEEAEEEEEKSFCEETIQPSDSEKAHEQLASMIGLESVKSKLVVFENLIRFGQMRKNAGLPFSNMPLHAMFLGSPGTGKTTVAKIIGNVLAGIGVLSKGHVVVRDRATLTGQYYSSEAEKTLEALEEAQGGILFIDEAYQLYQPADPKDPGHFVLDTLMTALADENKRDWMLILAGYTKPTKRLMEANPGLASRIPESNHYYFEDFTAEQLEEIAQRWLNENNYILDADAAEALSKALHAEYENRDDDFGNARNVINMLQTQVLPAMACRVAQLPAPSDEDLRLVHANDIPLPRRQACRKRGIVGFSA